jgi:hypothetical protein
MIPPTDDSDWVLDLATGQVNQRGQAPGASVNQPLPSLPAHVFDPADLTSFKGIAALDHGSVPADLVTRTKSRWFKVQQYYQMDDVSRWRAWKNRLDKSGSREKWLFYACPLSLAEDVFANHQVAPYGDFFPRTFGREAFYFFDDASQAAQIAFKFGVEREGFLVSCRVITGEVAEVKRAYPAAVAPPTGYDSVMASKGTDLGAGPLIGPLIALFDSERALLRYTSHIVMK